MYNGAKWFWVYGEKIPRYLDLQNSVNTLTQNINMVNNDMWNLYWQNRNYTDQKISEINMQRYVDDGYDYIVSGTPSIQYSVTNDSPSPYGFNLESDGFYTSQNQGVGESYAYALIELNNTTSDIVTIAIQCKVDSETLNDKGYLSYLNTRLDYEFWTSTNAILVADENNKTYIQEYTLDPGYNYITVKYGKDPFNDQGTDCFKFKVVSVSTERRHNATKEYVDSEDTEEIYNQILEVSALSGRIDAIKPNIYVKASKSSMNLIPSPVTNDICYIVEDLNKPIGKEIYPGLLTFPSTVTVNTLSDGNTITLKDSTETVILSLVKMQQTVTITLTEPDNQMTTVTYTTADDVNYTYSSGPQSIMLNEVLDVLSTWDNDELAEFVLTNTKMLTNTYIYDGMWKQIRDEKTSTLTTVSVALSQLTTVGGN